MRKIFALILILALLLGCPSPPDPDNGGGGIFPPAPEKAKWTIMVYLDSDNNLEPAAIMDIDEMEMAGSNEDVRIIIQWDRAPGYDESNGDWTGTKRFLITNDLQEGVVASQEIMDLEEADMANPDTLSGFIKWVMENYPAEHYALFLWNHGGGWTSHSQDETNGTEMNLPITEEAFQKAGLGAERKLDLLMFDQCLMGQIDVAYAVAPYAEVLVASEDVIPFFSINYSGFLGELKNDPEMDGKKLAGNIVSSYADFYTNEVPNPYTTLTAIDLSKMDPMSNAFRIFAASLKAELQQHWPEIGKSLIYSESFATVEGIAAVKILSVNDLLDFADIVRQKVDSQQLGTSVEALKAAVKDAVIAEYHGTEHPYATGLTMYFPDDEILYRDQYPQLSKFGKDSGWDDFIRNYIALEKTDTIAPVAAISQVSSATASFNNPVEISGEVSGNNIVEVYRIIGTVQGNTIYLLSSWPIEYTTKTYEGDRVLPDFADGVSPIIYDWATSVRVLTDGETTTIAPVQPFGKGTFFYSALGEYLQKGNNEPFTAQLIFDLRHGGLLGALQVIPTGGESTMKEFLPQVGDSFTPYIETYDMGTGAYGISKSDPIDLGENGIWVDFSLVPEGKYIIGIIVQDVTGNAGIDMRTVEIVGQKAADFSIIQENLVGKWLENGVVLEINEDGSCKTVAGVYEKPCTYWFRNNGLPLLSLFSEKDDSMFIHFVVLSAEKDSIILAEVLDGAKHVFYREGTEPPTGGTIEPPPQGSIDSALLGKWENQQGNIEFKNDSTYAWNVAGTIVNGTFSASNGALAMAAGGKSTNYGYRIAGSTLTITDPEGNSLIYSKSGIVAPPQASSIVGSWYNRGVNETVTFNPDGTYTSYISGMLFVSGSYSTADNILILANAYSLFYYTYTISDNFLILYDQFYGTTASYVRVS
ncbi:MAG: clostripain-related cysteine peptidase [Candidatus Diapherotrites archaeon]